MGPKVIEKVIGEYTRESGVRALDKNIAKIVRTRAKNIGFDEQFKPEVTAADVEKILGVPRFQREEYEVGGIVGVVTGLAWTEVGGDILYIESILTPGKGALTMTGNLGDVMKESATIALQWVKAHSRELGIDPEMFEQDTTCNIHVPEGAIPKDGPSGRYHDGDFARLDLHRPQGQGTRRDDGRDDPPGPRDARRRDQGEDPRRQARRHHTRSSSARITAKIFRRSNPSTSAA